MPKVRAPRTPLSRNLLHPQPAFLLPGTPEDLSAEQEEVGGCDSMCCVLASI